MASAQTPDELRQLGEALWHQRWDMLIKEYPFQAYMRALDMNADGAVTITDVWLWFQWAFWLPGDYAIIALMRWLPAVASFLELGPDNLTGWLSGIISAFVWLAFLSSAGASR